MASEIISKAEKEAKKNEKRTPRGVGELEYAVFDYNTGSFKTDKYKVNSINAKQSERKYVNPLGITIIDNRMFINSSRIKIKPLAIVFGCLGALVCPPIIAIPFMSGNAKKGSGYIGNIIPLK